ncbi:hypothetical protein TU64_27990 [Bacillus cereus]|nr:hypothetical protein TU64_27990 [Bacillus cereus]
MVITTFGCSNSKGYSSKEAIKRGDIVYQQSKVANLARFEQFLMNLSNKKEDTIRVTNYTHEGDPIFQDLKFDGKSLKYTYDNLSDQFAGENKSVETDVCKEIIKKEIEQGEIEFFVSGCAKQQDSFLFRVEKSKLKHD